jgi:hypothetical protein
MALGGKTSKKFYVTSGGGGDEINSTRKTALDAFNTADAATGYKQLIDDNTLGPLIVNLQEMQDDIDELRRFVATASELRTIISPVPTANGGTGITGTDYYPVLTKKVTITQAQCNNLHTAPVMLVTAPGSGLMINPISAMIYGDIADPTTQLQTNSRCNLHIGHDNGGAMFGAGLGATHFIRRYMYNVPVDKWFNFAPTGAVLNDVENQKLLICGENRQGFPNNTFTKLEVYVTYQIVTV